MRFDLTDLRLFVNVHGAGSITGGAEASHMTLASASERIRAMEESLGSPLFVRGPRGVQPTAAGHTLVQHARAVLLQLERMQGELADYGAGLKGQVRLLCNTSSLSEDLPDALGGFLAEHPGLSVDVEERPSHDIADALRHGLCDLGLLSDSADLNGLQARPLRADPLVLVVPAGHALAQRASVSLAEVAGEPFVGLGEGSALHAHVAQQARRLGTRLAWRVRLRSLEAVCRMVGQGVGVGIVPLAVARRSARSAGIRRVALDDSWARRQLVLGLPGEAALTPHAKALAAHLHAHATTRPATAPRAPAAGR